MRAQPILIRFNIFSCVTGTLLFLFCLLTGVKWLHTNSLKRERNFVNLWIQQGHSEVEWAILAEIRLESNMSPMKVEVRANLNITGSWSSKLITCSQNTRNKELVSNTRLVPTSAIYAKLYLETLETSQDAVAPPEGRQWCQITMWANEILYEPWVDKELIRPLFFMDAWPASEQGA